VANHHPQHTISALAYVRAKRQNPKTPDQATWFDVTDAYDAGLMHALQNRASAQRVWSELGDRIEKLTSGDAEAQP
jgi:hypothetical protein